jgi:hypothetical protein
MIGRNIKYEMPEIFREQDPNQAVAQKQLERLAGLVPLEFGSDIFDWLTRPDAPTAVSFPDVDPIQGSTISNQIYTTRIYNYNTTTGGSSVRYVLYRLLSPTTSTIPFSGLAGDLEIPFTGTLLDIVAYVDTAGVTGSMIVDVNKNGTSFMTTTKVSIETGEKSSRNAVSQPVLTTTTVTEGDIVTFDIDSVQTTAAKGLSVLLVIQEE